MAYRIGSLERLTGISRNTLTAWERRYGLVRPTKDASGYRTYSDDDLALLRRVKTLVDQGYQIREAIDLARADVPARRASSDGEVGDALLGALLDLDRHGADRLHQAFASWSFRQRIDGVYLPLLRRVGDLWAADEVTVAQEHFASGFIREKLVSQLASLGSGPVGGPSAVCVGFPGESHELGLLAVAVHLALRGYRVTWLGANLPASELAKVLDTHPADLVCLSVLDVPPRAVLAHSAELSPLLKPHSLLVYGGPACASLTEQSSRTVLYCCEFSDLERRLAQPAGQIASRAVSGS